MPQSIFDDSEGMLAMLRDSVATLASRQPGAASVRQKRAAGADMDKVLWTAMAQAGWTGILIPEDLGGAGLSLTEQAVVSEALGRALISEPVATGAVFASILLARADASVERGRLVAGLVDGSLILAPAWKDGIGRSVSARAADGGYMLSGEKRHVDLAVSATDFLVVAALDGGFGLFSVPAKGVGLSVETAHGVDGAAIGTVRFDQCWLPQAALLARASSEAELLDAAITSARVALAAELAGIASRAVEITIDYTKARVQFGKPIASFQVVQHRLVDMWSDAEFACAAVVNAVETLADGDAQAGRMAVLAAKARAGDAAVSICRRAVHLHGAMGFTDECDIGLYLKRAISLNATLGQPEDLRLEFVNLERAA
ncbi:acyl-CoA dehydrogenase [Aquibium carbonis]|uniref:Acyl-CoA dehydrogenase n=1 Tax=Aquibium carbonis TaxID=2495581 RepID=A0A3S0GAT0_9HYPH|nr:acyl-CoA dehydrogenase family protein [Aquibium carbonis]RST87649.1 acyl-CoA dehydrogenase [Aquibium carbonis]